MPFECKKHHCNCEAKCCGVVPIPMTTWAKNQHNIQRVVVHKHKVNVTDPEGNKKNCILPLTEDCYCPFLKKDLSCAIYKDRPIVCQKFGDETHFALKCPVQHADGTPRSEESKAELDEQIKENLRKYEKKTPQDE